MFILTTFYLISVSFNYLFIVYPSIFWYLILCYKGKISLFLAVFMGFSHKKFHLSPIYFLIPHTISTLICSYFTTLSYFTTFLLTSFSYSHILFLILWYSDTLILSKFSIFLSTSKSLIYKYPLKIVLPSYPSLLLRSHCNCGKMRFSLI